MSRSYVTVIDDAAGAMAGAERADGSEAKLRLSDCWPAVSFRGLTGGAADGGEWLSKARRTLSTAAGAADADHDAGGHYVVAVAVRSQFGAVATELIDAAEQLLAHLAIFG
jgi:hypothetical protein